jgi:hypothetical protein
LCQNISDRTEISKYCPLKGKDIVEFGGSPGLRLPPL